LKTGPKDDGDVIRIEQIELLAYVGVPEDERSRAQRLTISVVFWPNKSRLDLKDDIAQAVDYAAVTADVKKFVASRRDKLIETLANALALHLLESFEIRRITIELRKYILPDVEFVSATVTRERSKE
jgi:7,8-dihydroneopterin aldolase/epimerase/oxygenase